MNSFSATTILMVRRDGKTCMASDGQVTFNNTIIKASANKVKRAGKGQVLVGFAGGAADGLALYSRFEAKLDEYQGNLERAVVELAKDWRTDRRLRRLEALLCVADTESSFVVSGNGDVIEPEDDLMAIGSGGPYAQAAAMALLKNTELEARDIVEQALIIAGRICVFTNQNIIIEQL